jgi:hypothetical protein
MGRRVPSPVVLSLLDRRPRRRPRAEGDVFAFAPIAINGVGFLINGEEEVGEREKREGKEKKTLADSSAPLLPGAEGARAFASARAGRGAATAVARHGAGAGKEETHGWAPPVVGGMLRSRRS